MFKLFIVLVSLHFCSTDQSKNSVHQTPAALIKEPGESVQISCNHSNTNFDMIQWYKQPVGKTDMTLLGYVRFSSQTVEKEFQNLYNVTGSGSSLSSLVIPKLRQSEDSAVYFCAASDGTNNANEAYFGKGTKLTVLEDRVNITEPTVEILRPSPRECRDQNKTEGIRRKTLVCVASGFYPDHVSVFWQRNGQNIIDGVATDAAATKNESSSLYSITSRLRLKAKTWFNPDNKFTCFVTFFNGTDYTNYTESIYTNESDTGMTRERYLRITQNAKLSYSALILKSCLYAALVCLLAWKLQSSPKKQKQ